MLVPAPRDNNSNNSNLPLAGLPVEILLAEPPVEILLVELPVEILLAELLAWVVCEAWKALRTCLKTWAWGEWVELPVEPIHLLEELEPQVRHGSTGACLSIF